MPSDPAPDVTAVVLAGGRATRMGGQDKGLVTVAGKPMIAWVLEALAPQAGRRLINANRNLDAYAAFGCEVVPDTEAGFLGPLAGLAAALAVARSDFVLTVPCDSPLLAPDLAERLHAASLQSGADIAVAHDGERLQPVFALYRREVAPSLATYLAGGGRKIDRWYAAHSLVEVDFSDRRESFLNVNDPAGREALEARMAPRTAVP